MDTFTIRIDLGNDAMRTAADIQRALVEIADRMLIDPLGEGDERPIPDYNGNIVGRYGLNLPTSGETADMTPLEQAIAEAEQRITRYTLEGHPVAAREWAEALAALHAATPKTGIVVKATFDRGGESA